MNRPMIRDGFLTGPKWWPVILVLGCCAMAFSAPPVPIVKSTIEEGTEIVPGDILTFDASASTEAKLFKWAVEPATFADGKPTNEVSSDFKSLRLASRTGTYILTLAVANETDIVLMRRFVVVGKPQPPPQPNPNPFVPDPPKPSPPKFPDEELGLSSLAYSAGMAQPNKSKAPALAKAFKQVGGAAVAGGHNSLKEVELASVEANRKALAGDKDPNSPEGKAAREEWLPFFKAIQPKILEVSKSATPQQYGKGLIEIATGLEAVK